MQYRVHNIIVLVWSVGWCCMQQLCLLRSILTIGSTRSCSPLGYALCRSLRGSVLICAPSDLSGMKEPQLSQLWTKLYRLGPTPQYREKTCLSGFYGMPAMADVMLGHGNAEEGKPSFGQVFFTADRYSPLPRFDASANPPEVKTSSERTPVIVNCMIILCVNTSSWY